MKGEKVSQDQLSDLQPGAKWHHLALAADPRWLVGKNLGDAQPGARKPRRSLARPAQARGIKVKPQRLLAAVGAKPDQRIGVLRAEQEVHDACEHPVSGGS